MSVKISMGRVKTENVAGVDLYYHIITRRALVGAKKEILSELTNSCTNLGGNPF